MHVYDERRIIYRKLHVKEMKSEENQKLLKLYKTLNQNKKYPKFNP